MSHTIHRNMDNYFHLILGPMYAEKSSNLLRHYRRFKILKKRCLLVKYAEDNRYTDENYIATHDRVMSTEKAVSVYYLADTENAILNKSDKPLNLEDFDVICIDEIQFYPDKLAYCQKWWRQGKIVIACGLYADFKRDPFPQMPEMIAIADKVEFLNAICLDCEHDSAMTSYRIASDKQQVLIGGKDEYIPLCQKCYEKRNKKT